MSEREWMALYEAEEALRLIAEEVRNSGVFVAEDGHRSVAILNRHAILDILDSVGINARNPIEIWDMSWGAEQWDKEHPHGEQV